MTGINEPKFLDDGRRMNTFVIVKNEAYGNAEVTVVTKDLSMYSPRRTRENTFMGNAIVPPAVSGIFLLGKGFTSH